LQLLAYCLQLLAMPKAAAAAPVLALDAGSVGAPTSHNLDYATLKNRPPVLQLLASRCF